ncbi:hypothetical protein AUR66_16595 [Haloferax profundi]|uniref:Uncharacterized protein n=1 Tax=Haloferax profundi TaxID=1544718 RepID=A0A0W1SF40_9EURY|nr:hypothetical protein AUR66_16595 [Haloferax profundi]
MRTKRNDKLSFLWLSGLWLDNEFCPLLVDDFSYRGICPTCDSQRSTIVRFPSAITNPIQFKTITHITTEIVRVGSVVTRGKFTPRNECIDGNGLCF